MQVSVMLNRKSSDGVVTILAEATLAEAADLMAQQRIGAVVVLDGGRIAGILSERDIVRTIAETGGQRALALPVAEAMTRTVKTCAPGDTALEVLERMSQGRFRHMPVVDPVGKMVGILSIGDVVKARLQEIEHENAAMADLLSQ